MKEIEDYVSTLKNYLSYYEEKGYLWGNLIVIDEGKIVVEKRHGLSSVEFTIKNNSKTRFQIGSLTKAFTAMLMFILYQEKKVDIHESINQYIKDFPNSKRITIYHCLTCSSGIPNFTSFDNFWEETMRMNWTLTEMIDSFKNKERAFEPGAQFSYSSSDYLVLTKIIEAVTQISYGEALKKYILEPLGMNDTGCLNERDIVENLADSYSYWGTEIQAAKTDRSFPLGAYGIFSTTRDLAIWLQAIKENKLISENFKKQMLQPFQETYACGWDISEILGFTCYQHFGDIDGFVSSVKHLEKDNFTVIFLSNLEVIPVTEITAQIAKIRLGKEFTHPIELDVQLDRKSMEGITGEYVNNTKKIFFEIKMERERLYLYIAKKYEIMYKFQLHLEKTQEGEIYLQTDRVDERITFWSKQDLLRGNCIYKDYSGEKFECQKLK
ncbi:serine hydrolase domain-containing protein [Enterococcus rivorum]|uniref:Beta-lactamase-related domain-containing protein n=1 Tax=Enterococcus rivorum TaxID=762845 RepID=A0A1E5KSP9_9ENTE|nr:serine hydrolase domain-containing protein [Enterococcus rivorum]MBP2098188.1 CubicO group peptidase (beta-lactamase class C family) [Enterococcus rivorum]OEH80890.1 hypothetical protein BCR26_06570 [Enterococcus rivorum]